MRNSIADADEVRVCNVVDAYILSTFAQSACTTGGQTSTAQIETTAMCGSLRLAPITTLHAHGTASRTGSHAVLSPFYVHDKAAYHCIAGVVV